MSAPRQKLALVAKLAVGVVVIAAVAWQAELLGRPLLAMMTSLLLSLLFVMLVLVAVRGGRQTKGRQTGQTNGADKRERSN